MNWETFSLEDLESAPGDPRPKCCINVRKKICNCRGHIPRSINTSKSHLALGMKALKSGVGQYGPNLHPKDFPVC